MKTKVKQISAVAFLALFILIGNVNAKGTEKSGLGLENTETALEIEVWMINDAFWNTGNNFTIEEASEETLTLECWMTDKNTWKLESGIKVETETEQKLGIESWMISENIWNR